MVRFLVATAVAVFFLDRVAVVVLVVVVDDDDGFLLVLSASRTQVGTGAT